MAITRYRPGRPLPAANWPPMTDRSRGGARRGRGRGRGAWLITLLAGFGVAVGWVEEGDPGPGLSLSDRGLLVVALAAVVALVLAAHHSGGAKHLLRTVAEFAVVAVLAVLLATGTTAAPPAAKPTHGTAHGTATAQPSPVDQARAWLTAQWHRFEQADKPAAKKHPAK